MKRLIFLFALIGFFIAGMQSASAQVNYSITINWDDQSYDCTSVTVKKLTWALERIGATPPQIDGDDLVNSTVILNITMY